MTEQKPSQHIRSVDQPADGMTLLELIFAVSILAILTLVSVSLVSNAIEKSRIGTATADILIIEAELQRYRTNNNNQLPEVLLTDRRDPWGRPYLYTKLEGVKGKGSARKDRALNPLNTDFDLFSAGKNGVFKTQISQKDSLDDIIRARNGAYVGRAEDF
ncbi:MAG: prepilin-type N-terminal cleavage/methylation domain-containing protein [Alphaproteobacteria bacterium]|nr:MAG: prepilin-type N-terminal cleavage/methylation domain-containing protein [Alphaproteobacteria bacterium]